MCHYLEFTSLLASPTLYISASPADSQALWPLLHQINLLVKILPQFKAVLALWSGEHQMGRAAHKGSRCGTSVARGEDPEMVNQNGLPLPVGA